MAMSTDLYEQIKELSVADRLKLVEEIWNSIAEENESLELTEDLKLELDRRLNNSSPGRRWDEIKAEYSDTNEGVDKGLKVQCSEPRSDTL